MWLVFWLTALDTHFTLCISLQQLSIPHPHFHCTWSINNDEDVCIMYVFPRQSYNKNQRHHVKMSADCSPDLRGDWAPPDVHILYYTRHGLALSILLSLMSQHTPNVSDSWVRWHHNSVCIVHMLKHTMCTNRIGGTAKTKHTNRMHMHRTSLALRIILASSLPWRPENVQYQCVLYNCLHPHLPCK